MRRPRLPRSFHQQIVVLTAGVTAAAMLLLTLVLQLVLAHLTRTTWTGCSRTVPTP